MLCNVQKSHSCPGKPHLYREKTFLEGLSPSLVLKAKQESSSHVASFLPPRSSPSEAVFPILRRVVHCPHPVSPCSWTICDPPCEVNISWGFGPPENKCLDPTHPPSPHQTPPCSAGLLLVLHQPSEAQALPSRMQRRRRHLHWPQGVLSRLGVVDTVQLQSHHSPQPGGVSKKQEGEESKQWQGRRCILASQTEREETESP